MKTKLALILVIIISLFGCNNEEEVTPIIRPYKLMGKHTILTNLQGALFINVYDKVEFNPSIDVENENYQVSVDFTYKVNNELQYFTPIGVKTGWLTINKATGAKTFHSPLVVNRDIYSNPVYLQYIDAEWYLISLDSDFNQISKVKLNEEK